ncbi:hypothetical protein YYC_03244 [Plasmodium yoelii 17X]|uniref:Uncharacterized protein n=1 Tax=Plasmodium yoelii 17X TaxID=1323249 RepID=V7PJW8_PLAYE|nr:hypothetical protein YYC_03244 [Plasmodium yoelii 17X]
MFKNNDEKCKNLQNGIQKKKKKINGSTKDNSFINTENVFQEKNKIDELNNNLNKCSISSPSFSIVNEDLCFSKNGTKDNESKISCENNVIEKLDNGQNEAKIYDSIMKNTNKGNNRIKRKHNEKNKSIQNNIINKDMLKSVLNKCIELKRYIVTYKMNIKTVLNHLFNEYMFLKKYMICNYNVYHKIKFYHCCNHYLKKFNNVLLILHTVIEQNDEYLMFELYDEIKNNLRLQYYVGRILSNNLTCIAYKKAVYVIITCISRIHTLLNCILVSDPFKHTIPQILNLIRNI